MNKTHLLWLLVLLSSSPLAETLEINDFHDRNHVFIFSSDGSRVPFTELGLTNPPFKLQVIGKEGGQYLFKGTDGEQYRVFVPEAITNKAKIIKIECDRPQILLADDQSDRDARGVKGECL